MNKVAKVTPNIALDSAKQKDFSKSIKQVKKQVQRAPTAAATSSCKGIVYISHLPHGFYEAELRQYFKQFGKITNVRVLRSHKTGGSKGAAFVEFADREVAKVAAETMDNYIMFKRRLEAKFVDPDIMHKNLFKVKITSTRYPKKTHRTAECKVINTGMTEKKHEYKIKQKLKKLKKAGLLDCVQVFSEGMQPAVVDENTQPEPVAKQKKAVAAEHVMKAAVVKPGKKPKLTPALLKKKDDSVIFEDDEIVIREPLKIKNKGTPLAEKTKVKRTVNKSASIENDEVVVSKSKVTASPQIKKRASIIKKNNDSPRKTMISVEKTQEEINDIVIPEIKLTKSPKGKNSSPKKAMKSESPKGPLSTAYVKNFQKKGIANIPSKNIAKNGIEKSTLKTIKKTKKAPSKINAALLGGLINLDSSLVKKVDLAGKRKGK